MKPTVLFVCYGMRESFEVLAELEGFVKGYERLLDMRATTAAPGARVVLISPIRHEALGPPYPDPTAHTRDLKLYTDARRQLAAKRGVPFANLFDNLIPESAAAAAGPTSAERLTDNGIHLTPAGYLRAAVAIEAQLGLPPRGWTLTIDAAGAAAARGEGATARVLAAPGGGGGGGTSIEVTPALAPVPAVGRAADPRIARVLTVTGLKPGTWSLKAGDKPVARASAEQWAAGLELPHAGDPAAARLEELRQLIVSKNVQYFNRYRPQNETYIFGFRKGEQGRNAVEIPMFDKPIAEKEAAIAKLRAPVPATYSLRAE